MPPFRWLQTGSARLVTRRFAGAQSHSERLDRPLLVAHLTDQHFGPATPHELQIEAVRRVNEAKPDVVMLTGDYVGYSLDYLDELEEVLSEIDGPTFAVLGNHDHWTDPRQIQQSLARCDIEVLSNVWTERCIAGQKIQIVGVDDAFTGHSDVEKATKGLNSDRPSIALSHVGEEADALWNKGIPLVLSGHTHSGQLSVGNMHRVVMGHLAGHRYVHGLYGKRTGVREGAVYVSAGIGSSKFGLRLGERARPEIALFDIGKAPDKQELLDEQLPVHRRIVPESKKIKRRLDAMKKQHETALKWRK